MSDLRELYQQVILDHNKSPRNYGKIENPDAFAHGNNPLCGDTIDIYLKIDNNIITDVKFEGAGCAICTSSASMMTEALIGKSEKDAESLFDLFHKVLTEDEITELSKLGKLAVLTGVKDYPVRVKCATLAWHTFHAALKKNNLEVSTE